MSGGVEYPNIAGWRDDRSPRTQLLAISVEMAARRAEGAWAPLADVDRVLLEVLQDVLYGLADQVVGRRSPIPRLARLNPALSVIDGGVA